MADPEIATLEEILTAGERMVELPVLSGTAGRPRKLRVRKISSDEYRALLPPHPTEAMDWPEDKKEFREREFAWIKTLSQEELDRRGAAFADIDYRIVALVSLDPKLTLDDARRLGEDANTAADEILKFSLPKKDEKKKAEEERKAADAKADAA